MKNVIVQPDHYISFNATGQLLKYMFCVHGNSILIVDTTFELCNGLWLTDGAFINESLIKDEGDHPYLPG